MIEIILFEEKKKSERRTRRPLRKRIAAERGRARGKVIKESRRGPDGVRAYGERRACRLAASEIRAVEDGVRRALEKFDSHRKNRKKTEGGGTSTATTTTRRAGGISFWGKFFMVLFDHFGGPPAPERC